MKIYHIDTCLPDYFAGHNLPVVQIIIDNTTTYSELRVMMLSDYCIDHIETIDTEEYKQAVCELFNDISDKLDNVIDSSLDSISDYENNYDYVYMFFAIDNEEEQNND